jgi:hypothetical protein
MQIGLKDIAGSNVLAGALNGRNVLGTLLSMTVAEPASPMPIFLDFAGIDVATVSFLRECILGFRDIIRGRRSSFYPVVANANDTVRDELLEALRPRGDMLMTCTLDASRNVNDVTPIGEFDPKQRLTYDLVRTRGEIDAGQLMREFGQSEGVTQPAWNNRLSALAARGLIVEVSEGRAKRYKPIFEGA